MVLVLEKVQNGLFSGFGVAGLYITFVFGVGRFLRLSTTDLRMRVPY